MGLGLWVWLLADVDGGAVFLETWVLIANLLQVLTGFTVQGF